MSGMCGVTEVNGVQEFRHFCRGRIHPHRHQMTRRSHVLHH
jgi:hypothetical protein